MASVVLIIPPERFRDEELFHTQEELRKEGHKTLVASTVVGECLGSRGGRVASKMLLSEIYPNDFDAVVFVGGGGSKLLFENEQALSIAKQMHAQNKVVAAICLAPVILANAGVLKGRRATVCGKERRTIEQKGAYYTGPGVTADGKIVTANGPKSSRLFGQKINELLTK